MNKIVPGIINRRYLRVKAFQAIYGQQVESTDYGAGRKNMLKGIEHIYDLYLYLMQLAVEIHHRAELNIELNKNKQIKTAEDDSPNLKFVNNKVLLILRENRQFQKEVKEHKIDWGIESENIKKLWRKVRDSNMYATYMEGSTQTFDEDQNFVIKIFKKHIAEFEILHEYLEDVSIYWQDDLGFLIVNVFQTIQNLKEDTTHDDKILFPLHKDKEDEIKFVTDLYRKTLINGDELNKTIDRFTINWDLDRIAKLDTILMKMALCEMIYFPSIPLKVTINEYIDLAREYSTPKSAKFVNGVLDNMSQTLKKEGVVVKSGRGLLN